MIIPSSKKARDDCIDTVVDICQQSRQDRDVLYTMRRRFLDFGTNDYTVECKYNRLEAHLDLVTSFLYAADHCRYSFSAPRNVGEPIINQVMALQDEWNDQFRDCGLAYTFSDAVYWALALDSMFIKLGWSNERESLYGKLFLPTDFAVYDESEPDLDSQEAFVHTYSINYDNAVQRLIRAGKSNQIKNLKRYPGIYSDTMPPVLSNLLIDATGGANMAGAMIGRASADFQPRATYEPNSENPMVRFHEVWAWDDNAEDYCIFTKVDGVEGCLSDSRETIAAYRKADVERAARMYSSETNIFLDQEHPFVPVVPYKRPDFFWGKAHSDILIPLQIWTNERLQQIADLLEQNVDPAKVATGFQGLTDEKLDALGGPGTWVYEQVPGAKVDTLRPPPVPDLFAEFKEIGSIFLEASGLTETIMGRQEQGANTRSAAQAKHAVMTGSGRIKKVAVSLEEPLQKLADIGLKLLQKNSKIRLISDSNEIFLPTQLRAERIKIRVAGHSHSPLFADESKEQAAGLFKAQAIDREDLLRMLNPPDVDHLIHKLRKRVNAEAQQKAQQAQQEANKPPRRPAHASRAA